MVCVTDLTSQKMNLFLINTTVIICVGPLTNLIVSKRKRKHSCLFKWTYESRGMKYNTDLLHSDRIPRETNMDYLCHYLHQKIWAKLVLKPEPQEGGSGESVSKETMNEPENMKKKKKKMRKA
ncbi:hypothetical protein Tco_0041798 [Tanacetum coccineum]